MKISAATLATLSNFSKINNSIFIEKGNVIKTRPNLSSSPTAKKIVEDMAAKNINNGGTFEEFQKMLKRMRGDDPDTKSE